MPNWVNNLSCFCLRLSLDVSFLINRGWCLKLLHRIGVLSRKIINEFWFKMICVIIIKRLGTHCTNRCRILVDRHYLILKLWPCHILMWRKTHCVLLEISLLLILVGRCNFTSLQEISLWIHFLVIAQIDRVHKLVGKVAGAENRLRLIKYWRIALNVLLLPLLVTNGVLIISYA